MPEAPHNQEPIFQLPTTDRQLIVGGIINENLPSVNIPCGQDGLVTVFTATPDSCRVCPRVTRIAGVAGSIPGAIFEGVCQPGARETGACGIVSFINKNRLFL